MTNMPPPQAFATGILVAMRILSSRALCFVSLFMTCGFFVGAMLERSVIAFAAATTFAVITYLPALWRDHKGSSNG